MPAVQVASRHSTRGKKSNDDMPVEGNTPKEKSEKENTVKEELEVKPVIVCKKPPKNRDGEPVLTVAMKPLQFYPAKKKLPTARRGKPFICVAGQGGVMHSVSEHEQYSVSVLISDDDSNKRSDDNITKEGDASIETDDTSYEMWLVAEGLKKLQESKENICKKKYNNDKSVKEKEKNTKKVDDSGDQSQVDDSGDQKKVDDSGDEKEMSVSSDEKKGENLSVKLEKFKGEVEMMISQGKGEEYSEEKIKKLKTILSLLASDNNDDICKKEEKGRQDKELHQQEIEEQEARQEEENRKVQDEMLCIAAEEEQQRLAEERVVEAEKIRKIKEKEKVNEGQGPKTPEKADNIERSIKNEDIKDVQVKEEDGRERLHETKKNMNIINTEEIRKIDEKGVIVDDTVKETEDKIGVVVGGNDDNDSENLVIAEETVVESNSRSGNGKHVSFCFQGDDIGSGVEKSCNDTEENVDIDTTMKSNVTLETVGDSSNVETSTSGNTSCQYLKETLDADEFVEEDEDDYDIPLTQNVHRERYLKYKPGNEAEEDEREEEEWEEKYEDDKEGEEQVDEVFEAEDETNGEQNSDENENDCDTR